MSERAEKRPCKPEEAVGVPPADMFALVTLTSWCNALHTQHLALDSVVENDPDKAGVAIADICYGDGWPGHAEADAEMAATRVVVTIAASASPFDSVPLQCVTVVASVDEFLKMRVCAMLKSRGRRLYVVENGTAGTFTRSIPRSCLNPYCVASDEDLVDIARRLCTDEDFEEAELNPQWMLAFCSKPWVGLPGLNYVRTDVGLGISSTVHGDDLERRCFRTLISIQTRQQSSMKAINMSWNHAGVSPAALFPFSAALPALCAVVYGSRVVRQQIMRTGDLWHTAALAMCLCPPHSTLNSSFSSISRAFQLRLQLLGGVSHALLEGLGLPCRARTLVACKIASSLARHIGRCFNEEADRRWVAFIVTKVLWDFLWPEEQYLREQHPQ